MSKASEHVSWCLRKAQEDAKSGRLHRGLVKVKSDEKLALEFVKKAEKDLEVQWRK